MDNKESKSLFFIRNLPGRTIREKINLSEVSDCRMYKTERRVKYHKEFVNVMDYIEVVLSLNNQQQAVKLEFYNAEYDQLTLTGELQLAQKWTDLIKSIIKTGQLKKDKKLQKELVDPELSKPVGRKRRTPNRRSARHATTNE